MGREIGEGMGYVVYLRLGRELPDTGVRALGCLYDNDDIT